MPLKLKRPLPFDWRTLVSAGLIVLAFPPWEMSFLLWFCLVPWFFSIQRSISVRQAFRRGMEIGYAMTLGGFFWVASVLKEFGNLGWPLSILGFLIFALICQLQFPVFSVCLKMTLNRTGELQLRWAVLLSLLYCGIDSSLPKLFEDTLGHALYNAENLRQISDVGGPFLLTFLILFANFTVYQVWRKKWRPLKATVIASLLLLAWSYGFLRNQQIKASMDSPLTQVIAGVIQANIGDFEKLAAERGIRGAGQRVLDTYLDLSEQALAGNPRPDFLIWPETAFPSAFRTPRNADELSREKRIEESVRKWNLPLLFGGYDHANEKDYNSLFLLRPEGQLNVYHKNILLLFGEYIPGADSFSWIKEMFPQVGNFGRGPGPMALEIPLGDPIRKGFIKAAPAICYEVLFPTFILDAVKLGAQFVLNITNDSWFGPYGEPDLHLALSTFRSIESRVPMIRSTNTGYSALILPDGSIQGKSSLGKKEAMIFKVPILMPIPTLIKKWGDWFGLTSLFISLSTILTWWVLQKRKKIPGAARRGEI